MSRLPMFVLFTLLCGCGTRLAAVPHVESDVSIRVVEQGTHTERVLRAGSAEAQQFAKWLDENAGGWRGYYATTPADGIFVSTRLGLLQFNRNNVIAVRKEGQFTKRVSEDIYTLLRGVDN